MKGYVTATNGISYRVDRFDEYRTEGKYVFAGLVDDCGDMIERKFYALSWDAATLETGPTYVPAAPGYYLLSAIRDRDGKTEAFVRTDVIAWSIQEDGVAPVTPNCVYDAYTSWPPVICPGGHIEFDDGSTLASEAEYLAELNSEKRVAA